MEKLLHYAWKHRILPLKCLQTTDGRELEVIDPGLHNNDQGPDFFNAKVRMDRTMWAGNVEVHAKSTDWYRHNHQYDPFYNNVILHVVEQADCEIETADGTHPAQLEVEIPAYVRQNYNELCQTDDYPRCHRMIPQLSSLKAHMWMDALLAERMEERAGRLMERVGLMKGDWERATFVTLSRNFGFGLNGDAFERWARLIPLQAAGKHRDNLPQVEALFLGLAGLTDEFGKKESDETVEKWKREFRFLSHKFDLPQPMKPSDWKYLRTRPQSFPHIRIRQIAQLYHNGKAQMSALIEAEDIKQLHDSLGVAGTSVKSRNLIIINTVVPLLYAYGQYSRNDALLVRASDLLEQIPAEDNFILRQWKACGLEVSSAADSQALIQLKREYCDKKDCLRCRFGYEYLKNNNFRQ